MFVRSRFAGCGLLIVSLSLIAGCESKEKPTPTTTIAAPPPVEGQPTAVASVDTTSPAETNNTGTTPAIGTPTATVAPEGSLAQYATALAIVQPDHFAVIKFDMAAMRNSAFVQSLPVDPNQLADNLPVPGAPGGAAGEMAAGLEQVESLWVSLGPPRGADGVPVSFAVFAHCTSPQAANDALKSMQADPASADRFDHQGGEYFKSKQPGGPIWAVRGSDVYLSNDENSLRNAIAAAGKIADTEVLKKLASARLEAPLVIAGSFGPFKDAMSQMAVEALKDSPIPISPELGRLPQQLAFGVVAINPDAEAMIDIDAEMDAEQSAENLKTSLDGLVSLGKIMIGQQAALAAQEGEVDPETQQSFKIMKSGLDAFTVAASGTHVDASFNRFPELADVPAMMKSQIERAQAIVFMNNARMLGLAAHSQHDAMRRWPADVKTPDGTAILSWRYEVLPFLEGTQLIDQIKRDEAWNSTTNQAFVSQMPAVFQSPSTTQENMTTWKLVPDGHASGVMILDTGKGTDTPWSKPDEFVLEGKAPETLLGEEPAGGYIVVNRDGSVEQLPRAALVAKLSGKPAGETPAVGDPTAEPAPAEGPLAGQEPRVWTSGRSKIKAVLVGAGDGKVTLKRIDTNREFTVPLERLSQEDQNYVRSLNLPQ